MNSGCVWRRPGRSSAARGRLGGSSAVLAGLAICAHLLVAAHTVSHFDRSPSDGASQHCAVCAVGKRSAGVRTAVIAGWQCTDTWIVEVAGPPVAALPGVEAATLARGPPLSALAPIG